MVFNHKRKVKEINSTSKKSKKDNPLDKIKDIVSPLSTSHVDSREVIGKNNIIDGSNSNNTINHNGNVQKQYENILEVVLEAFPATSRDLLRDSFLTVSVMKILSEVDKLKHESKNIGILGSKVTSMPTEEDYSILKNEQIPEDPASTEEVSKFLVSCFDSMVLWGHRRIQANVIPAVTTVSVLSHVLCALFSPNLISWQYGRRLTMAEVELVAISSRLIGYDPQKSAGFSTFGGTGTVLAGIKVGISKALPNSAEEGVGHEPCWIICSESSHYCVSSIASWVGIGKNFVKKIPCDNNASMRIDKFEREIREILDRKEKVGCIVVTQFTTDHGAFDNTLHVVQLRDKLIEEYNLDYKIHIHADSVIGWAFSVFNDYDLKENPLQFPVSVLSELRMMRNNVKNISLADSCGFDYHKTGFSPYISSLFVLKDSDDLKLISNAKKDIPYLFQRDIHAGLFTLETSRAASGTLAALSSFLVLGKRGYQSIWGHLLGQTRLLRDFLNGHPNTLVCNLNSHSTVTLFRVSQDVIDYTWDELMTDSNLKERVEKDNDFIDSFYNFLNQDMISTAENSVMLSLTSHCYTTEYGLKVSALKSFIMSPFTQGDDIDTLISMLEKHLKSFKQNGTKK